MVMKLAAPVIVGMGSRCSVVCSGSGVIVDISCLVMIVTGIGIQVVRCIRGEWSMSAVMVLGVVVVVRLITDSCCGSNSAG